MSEIKEAAKRLIDNLPDTATWEDIMYELYVKNKIDEALKAVGEGRVVDHEDVKKKFGLS